MVRSKEGVKVDRCLGRVLQCSLISGCCELMSRSGGLSLPAKLAFLPFFPAISGHRLLFELYDAAFMLASPL